MASSPGIFRARCSKALALSKADSLLIFNNDSTKEANANFQYLSGTTIDNSVLLVTRRDDTSRRRQEGGARCRLQQEAKADGTRHAVSVRKSGAVLWATQMNFGQAASVSPFPVKMMPKGKFSEAIKPMLKGPKLGLDMNSISAERYLRLRRRLGKKVIDAAPSISKIRGMKDSGEIAKIARAVKLAKKILRETGQAMDKSMTELDVRAELLRKCLDNGCEPAFEPIVATGSSSRFPHYTPGKKKLNGAVLIDFGVRLDGYCSDLTRCFFLGSCKKEREAYAKVQDMAADIMEEIPNLKKAKELALFSEKLFKAEGLPKPIHSIGHGIGMEVHESPRLNAKSKDALLPGMALAIEPAAYFGDFGVRYEETILLEKGRAKPL